MTKPLLISSLVLFSFTFSTGCAFSKKAGRAKESNAIASEVEETYRKRWVDKRVGELVAQGVAADAARAQAENEFTEKYGFKPPAKK